MEIPAIRVHTRQAARSVSGRKFDISGRSGYNIIAAPEEAWPHITGFPVSFFYQGYRHHDHCLTTII